jgi:hypothetical protein
MAGVFGTQNVIKTHKKRTREILASPLFIMDWRGLDSNQRPPGYEKSNALFSPKS